MCIKGGKWELESVKEGQIKKGFILNYSEER